MKKKSQVTIFIIVGTIIIFAAVAAFMLISPNINISLTKTDDKTALKNSIEGCLSLMAKEWLFVHGLYTGYHASYNATYALDDAKIDMPSLFKTKGDLEAYLEDNSGICLEKNQGFQGYFVKERDPKFSAVLSDTKVIIKYSDLYVAEKNEDSISSGSGTIEIEQRTKYVLTEANELIQQRQKEKYMRGSKPFLDNSIYLEVAKPAVNAEEWLVSDKSNTRNPYYFAFLVNLVI